MLNKDLWYIIVRVNVKSLQKKKVTSIEYTNWCRYLDYLLVFYRFFPRYTIFIIEVVPVNYTRVHVRTYVNERILCMTFGINRWGKKAFKGKTSIHMYRYMYRLYNILKYIYLLIYVALLLIRYLYFYQLRIYLSSEGGSEFKTHRGNDVQPLLLFDIVIMYV